MNALGRIAIAFGAVVGLVLLSNEIKNNGSGTVLPGYVGGDPNEAHRVWTYDENTDSMSGQIIRTARITSSNAFELQPPYQGQQHAILVLRQSKRLGNSVILQISQGQLICDFRACTVPVRFDDESPTQWPTARPADNDTTTLFLGNYDHFVAKLNHSKYLRIEATFFQNGSAVLEFPTDGFDRALYEGNKQSHR